MHMVVVHVQACHMHLVGLFIESEVTILCQHEAKMLTINPHFLRKVNHAVYVFQRHHRYHWNTIGYHGYDFPSTGRIQFTSVGTMDDTFVSMLRVTSATGLDL